MNLNFKPQNFGVFKLQKLNQKIKLSDHKNQTQH